MKKKNFLDSVDVPVPCDKSWDEMIGDDVSRFCKHCEKDIYNISAMTRQEAKKLLFQSKERVCIRMEREPNGKIKTLKKQLHQITRQMPLAAGVLTASLILAGATNAQETKVETSKITITQIADKNSKPKISGTITDSQGALLPSIKVILRNTKDNSIRTTVADKEGFYEFKDVTPSVYILETKDKTGFKDFTSQNLSVEAEKNINLKITLVSNGKVELLGVDGIYSEVKTSILPSINKNVNPTISGTITDSNGAVITGIRILLRNTENDSIRFSNSNDSGFYEFRDVAVSTYEIVISSQNGFQAFVKNDLIIENNTNLELRIALKSGDVVIGQTIYVDDLNITTEKSPINTNFISQEFVPLPIPQNRTFMGLVLIPKKVKVDKNIQIKTSQISFTIFDPIQEVIPNADVKLTNSKIKQTFTAKTNDRGIAYFSLLPRGKYEVKASMQGFRSGIMSVIINEKIEPNIEMTLEVGTWTGVVSINWSEIPTFNAILQEDFENVKKSINSGFNVNTKDSSGKTALHFAAESGNLEIVKFLLSKGAKVNAKDKFNRTPILMIDGDEEEESIKILKLLIAKGADVNVQDKYESGTTLLMEVCDDENFEMAKILLEAGANPNLKDEDGETAMQKTKSEEIKKLLIKYGAKD